MISTSFGLIRPWNSQDVPCLVRYGSNRKIWLNMRDGFPYPFSEERAQVFLERVARQDPTTFFAIATQEEAIGAIGISINQDVHRLTAELAYWLGEPFWGKGIVTEAIIKFTEFCFVRFGLVRIYAEPYEANPASARVLEKAGFILEGRMRCSVIKEGRILDQLLYAKIREQG